MNISILTSGGDSPGMNAAIRSVVRSSISQGHKVFGVYEGYEGLLSSNFKELNLRSVANIIHRGGTFLKSARSLKFKSYEGRRQAYENLLKNKIEVLIALGGDGTIKGLEVFNSEHSDVQTIGIPCTIDNDYKFSHESIGFDTAVNTAVEAIDKVRDTASSHQRTFVIEVMGRESAELANQVAMAAGAECVVNAENQSSIQTCLKVVSESIQKGKKSSLVVVIEGQNHKEVAGHKIRNILVDSLDIDCRAVVLGHIQRGGSPTVRDRILASEMGYVASLEVLKNKSGVVVSEGGRVLFKEFKDLEALDKTNEFKKILTVLAN